MSTLTWSDQLCLNQPQMDHTHEEFVDLLGKLESALALGTASAAPALAAFLAHTETHFAQEERWMQLMGFAPENCHTFQHQQVLEVVREVSRRMGSEGDDQILRNLVAGLAEWFPVHAQMMDQALAETMALVGLDPETGHMARPPESTQEAITSCGSSSCA
jgi:hemerythrin